MWKKPETDMATQPYELNTKQPVTTPTRNATAVIGTSINFKGEITGKESLLIDGRVEGTVRLTNDVVTVGSEGSVQGDIYAKAIQVRGQIVGDLFGSDNVVVHQTGSVRGNITAPRVTLEDGAKLKGAIDMDPQTASSARAASSSFESTIKSNEGAAKSVESIEKVVKKVDSDGAISRSYQGASKSAI